MFLEISQNSQKKHLCQSLFLNKVERPATLLKKAPAQVFPCEFCEISKEHLFYITPPGDYFWETTTGGVL